MSEIINPQQATYWIITDGGAHASGETGPGQTTSIGYGWRVHWMGSSYDEYASQCATIGIKPRTADASPAQHVTARQVRLWLIQQGISLASVDAAISGIEDPATRETVQIEWEYAPYIDRDHPMLVPLGAALGLSEEQIDAAFVQAATL